MIAFATNSLVFTTPDTLTDLKDEVHERSEAAQWELKPCPCCGATPTVHDHNTYVQIGCSCKLCRLVSSSSMQDAAKVWNEFRFTD